MLAPLAVCLAVPSGSRRDVGTAVALAILVLLGFRGPADGFDRVVQAWVVLLAGSLAAVLALGRPRTWVARALTALTGATAGAALLLAFTGRSWGQVVWLAERHFAELFGAIVGGLTAAAATMNTAASAATLATLDTYAGWLTLVLSRLFPGLVALQSIAALALAWALYHRVAQRPQGDPLGPLAGFRFNDHLIWGVAGSLFVLVLPRLGWLNALGGNLLVFFGGLYMVRGVAVLSAAAAAGVIGGPFALVAAVFVTLFLMPVAVLAALALGLTDTLMDWRARLARTLQQP